jgi:hypothetical protein
MLNTFELLVAEMRKAQKQLFLKQSEENLQKAKRLEHSVDKMIQTKSNEPHETFYDWEKRIEAY